MREHKYLVLTLVMVATAIIALAFRLDDLAFVQGLLAFAFSIAALLEQRRKVRRYEHKN